MPQPYMLYDTAILDDSAPTNHVLYQVPKNGDSTHILAFTNMRGAGALPQRESFIITRMYAWVDGITEQADFQNLWLDATLTLNINNEDVIIAPLVAFAWRNGYMGHFTQASAANITPIGRVGDGWTLDPQVVIPGGIPFFVEIDQQTSLGAATDQMKIGLYGILDRG